MSARAALRAATAEAHERVDALFTEFRLSDPADYGRFLSAQAAAFIPTEQAIGLEAIAALVPDWSQRQRSHLLLADLAERGEAAPPPLPAPALTSPAAMLGAAYVLEGSRLGGAYLKRALPSGMPMRFLAAPERRGAWRDLLAILDKHLVEAKAVTSAAQAANMTFQLFERAALQQLQHRQAA